MQSGEYFKINTWYLSFKSESESVELFNSGEAAASTGTAAAQTPQQGPAHREAEPCLQV